MNHPSRLFIPMVAFEFIMAILLMPARIPDYIEGCRYAEGLRYCQYIDVSYPYMPAVIIGGMFFVGGVVLSILIVKSEWEDRQQLYN